MRIVYYSRPSVIDAFLPKILELGKTTELHLILEMQPAVWQTALFDVPAQSLPNGVIDAKLILADYFPNEIKKYWSECAGVYFAVFNCSKAIHPATWWASHKTVQFIRGLKPDLINIDNPSLRLSLALGGLKNIPIILNTHDPVSHSGEKSWRSSLSKWLTYRNVNQHIVHSSNLLSDFTEHYQLGRNNVKSIPLGVYDIYREWIRKPIKDDGKSILFFGRLSQYKGLDVLYRAASLVTEKIRNVKFVVAGRPVKGYSLPPTPNLPDHSSFEVIEGYISNERLAELFQQATIVVCPYIDATQSGVVLTAYAFNKPVVATRTGGLPEYVWDGKSGILVEPGNHRQLAEAIVKLLTDKAYLHQLQAGIEEIASTKLNWKKIAQQTKTVYSNLLGRK